MAELRAKLEEAKQVDQVKTKEIAQLQARLEAGKEVSKELKKVDSPNLDEVTALWTKDRVEHAHMISVLEEQLSARSEELGQVKKSAVDQRKEKEDTIMVIQAMSKKDRKNFDADVEELQKERGQKLHGQGRGLDKRSCSREGSHFDQ